MQPRLLPVQYTQQTSGAAFDERLVKSSYPIVGYYYIAWNEERPFFKDKRVRQALTMLIDRDGIVKNIRFGLGNVANGPFHPKSADYDRLSSPGPTIPTKPPSFWIRPVGSTTMAMVSATREEFRSKSSFSARRKTLLPISSCQS